MLIFFSPEEVADSWVLAHRRNDWKERNLEDTKIDKYSSHLEVNFRGIQGEKTVARIFDLQIDRTEQRGGDKGWDLDFCGVKIEVKVSRTDYLFILPGQEIRAHCLCLVKPYHEPWVYEFRGIIGRKKFLETGHRNLKLKWNDPPRFGIEAEKLTKPRDVGVFFAHVVANRQCN